MLFIFFILLIWMVALFHVREHRRFIVSLRALYDGWPHSGNIAAYLQAADWRQIGMGGDTIHLRRAFHIRSVDDLKRYALPILFAALMMIVLQSFVMAGGYLCLIAVKWFVTDTVFTPPPATAHYEVRIGRQVLFGENI